MKRIAQDIKSGQFGNVYLLYGEEAYLRRQYRDNLKKALVPEDDTMNCSVYTARISTPGRLRTSRGRCLFSRPAGSLSLRTADGSKAGMIKLPNLLKRFRIRHISYLWRGKSISAESCTRQSRQRVMRRSARCRTGDTQKVDTRAAQKGK